MNYLELISIQEKIVCMRDYLRNKISYVDDSGNRKLDSFYFLSAEVAAFKLLNSWNKRMLKGEEFIDDEVKLLLSLIETLVNGEFDDYSEYESDISMPLWYSLITGTEGESFSQFNKEVVLVASLAEMSNGAGIDQTLAATINYDDLSDPNLMSYAYSLAHDYLISMKTDIFFEFANNGLGKDLNKGMLYKYHFNLFQ